MSRGRRELRNANRGLVPDLRGTPRVAHCLRIGIMETMRDGKPHIQCSAPGVGLADLRRLLESCLAGIDRAEQQERQSIIVPGGP